MASIFGFTIKNIKTFRGREWDGCQGDIYYNGKKVGWYNNDGNGGCADIEFFGTFEMRQWHENKLSQATQEYFRRYPLEGEYSQLTPDAEMFMSVLIDLIHDEQTYKRYAKKGKPFMVTFVENGWQNRLAVCETDKVFVLADLIGEDRMRNVSDIKKFKGLEDFEIKWEVNQ